MKQVSNRVHRRADGLHSVAQWAGIGRLAAEPPSLSCRAPTVNVSGFSARLRVAGGTCDYRSRFRDPRRGKSGDPLHEGVARDFRAPARCRTAPEPCFLAIATTLRTRPPNWHQKATSWQAGTRPKPRRRARKHQRIRDHRTEATIPPTGLSLVGFMDQQHVPIRDAGCRAWQVNTYYVQPRLHATYSNNTGFARILTENAAMLSHQKEPVRIHVPSNAFRRSTAGGEPIDLPDIYVAVR
jgi:hypothetical protein